MAHFMNLRDLEYAVAVADHGHFGRAAAACNVSQPTLSGQILKLEAELGLKLFEREGRAVRVDARAAGVIAEARAALAAAADVTVAARAARDPFAGPLRIGMIATVAPYLLPFALPAAIKALPQTPLHLIEDLTDRLLQRMSEGALDAVVIATDPESARLNSIELYEEPFYLVSAPAPPGATAPIRSGSTRSIQRRCFCWRKGIACAIRRSRFAARRSGRPAPTCARPASRRSAISPRPVRARRSRRSSPSPTGGARATRLDGLRVVGLGASRLVRLIHRRNAPRRAAIEALAASLRASAEAALAACA